MYLDTSSSCVSRNDQIEEIPSMDIFDIEDVYLQRGRKVSKAFVSVLGSVRNADKKAFVAFVCLFVFVQN